MIYDLKKILDIGEENGFAVPAFNVYNLETVMGVMQAAEETGAPVIFQMYSRLFDSQIAQYVAPIIREAMNNMKTPVAFHLDHGAGVPEVLRAFRYGATGVMIDASRKPLEENIAITKGVVEMAAEMSIGVEGELGEVGKAAEGVSKDYTKVEDAAKFVNETGVCALAVAVGTAHGHYKQAPVLALKRIEELHEGQKAHLVLHGGSGVPDDQIAAAVKVTQDTPLPAELDSGMHKVVMIVQLAKFETLKKALNDIGVTGITVTQVMGCGLQKGSGEKYRGAEVDATLLPKVKVEVVVSKIPVEKVIDTATKVLYTGHIGDGKIFVYNVAKVVKVRTGEVNYAALQDVE